MIHAHKLALPLFAAIFAGATPCDALELFVAPGGNDSWSGKVREVVADGFDGPFATPQRAVQAAREWRAASADAPAPVTIRLRGGLHRMRQTLVLTPSDSGTASAPLIIEACPGEQPVLSGGRLISGWTVSPDGRWHVTLPEARDGQWKLHQLFVNGQRRFPPRVPRQGYHYVRGRSREQEVGGRKFFVNPGDVQAWRNLADVEVILFHQWVSSRHTIESFDTATHSVLLKDFARWLIGTFEPNQRYYLENVAEALDAPGDWYLDRGSGELTYCPMPGETPAETEVIAPVLRTLVSFEGDPAAGRFVEHVTLRGLSLRHAEHGVSPTDMAKDNQSSVDGFDSAIRARGLLHSTLENCEVAHVGEHAVRLHEGCRANRIERCHLHDLGGGGIYLGEAQIPHHEGRAPAPAPMQTGGNTIHNNFIHDGGYLFPAGIGVFIGHSAGNRVTHNEISSFNHLGISVGRTWGFAPSEAHHNQIEFNHVHHISPATQTGSSCPRSIVIARLPTAPRRHRQRHDRSTPTTSNRLSTNGPGMRSPRR